LLEQVAGLTTAVPVMPRMVVELMMLLAIRSTSPLTVKAL
jgi:hypothetical protein